MYLYHPHFYEVKKFLNQRLLGDILLISSKFSLPKMSNSGFRFLKSKGGSCLYDVGIYPISLILTSYLRPISQRLSPRLTLWSINETDGIFSILISANKESKLVEAVLGKNSPLVRRRVFYGLWMRALRY